MLGLISVNVVWCVSVCGLIWVNVVWCVTSCVCVWFNISEGSAMYDIVCGLYRWTCVPASLRFDILYVVLCWQVQLCADRPSPNTPAHDLSTLTAQGRQSRLLHDLLVGQGPNSVDLNTGTAAPHIGSRSALMCLSVTGVTFLTHVVSSYWLLVTTSNVMYSSELPVERSLQCHLLV